MEQSACTTGSDPWAKETHPAFRASRRAICWVGLTATPSSWASAFNEKWWPRWRMKAPGIRDRSHRRTIRPRLRGFSRLAKPRNESRRPDSDGRIRLAHAECAASNCASGATGCRCTTAAVRHRLLAANAGRDSGRRPTPDAGRDWRGVLMRKNDPANRVMRRAVAGYEMRADCAKEEKGLGPARHPLGKIAGARCSRVARVTKVILPRLRQSACLPERRRGHVGEVDGRGGYC